MRRRRGSLLGKVRVIGACAAITLGLLVVQSPAEAAETPTTTATGPMDTTLDPAPIPGDLASAIQAGPTEVVVAVESPDATAALTSAGDPAAEPATQQADIALAGDLLAADKDAALAGAGDGVRTVRAFDHLPVEVVLVDSPEALAALAAAPGVSSVQLPAQYRPTVDTDLTVINQPAAQTAGYTGAGVNVAVIDTGVDWLRSGVNGAFGGCSGGPGTGTCRIDRYVDVTGSGFRDTDPNGHGTNVSGVVAKTAPGAHLDVYGVFPSNLIASDTDILTALNDITQNGVARGIRAVNMSLGDSSHSNTTCTNSYSTVFGNLRALGILPVVSAGNTAYVSGTFTAGVSSPACAAGAIPVGATYPQSYSGSFDWGPGQCTDTKPPADKIACFSQGGSLVKLLAPGINITAAGVTESGTSQAAPHVAGAVADVVCANPHASGDQIAGFLTGTGKSITDSRGTTSTTPRRLDIAAAGAAAAAAGLSTAGGFVSLTPARLLDTRFGTGASAAGAVPPLGTALVKVAGQCGVPLTGVSAVVLNVTVTEPVADGHIIAYASGGSRPVASNVNFVARQTVPNLVVAPVGADGKVALFNNSPGGSVQLIADIAGYYKSGTVAEAGAFGSVAPLRLLDTRTGPGVPVGSAGTVTVDVTGQGGVPATGVSAVALNVTATAPTAPGFVSVYASGTTRPNVSNLNFNAGQTVPNLVFAPVGSDGNVTLFNNAGGTVHLIVDIEGYFKGGTVTKPGTFGSVGPSRLLDTRFGTGAPKAAIGAGGTVSLDVTGVGNVPASGVAAVVLNVTVTEPAAAGHIIAYAAGGKRPVASNVNFVPGQTVPNLVVVPVGATGNVALFNNSPGSVQLVADVAGYFLD